MWDVNSTGKESFMKNSGRCPKCDCTDIVADAKVIDRGHMHVKDDMTLAVYADPGAIFFQGERTTKVSAWVCTECGYVEFYAAYPKRIKLPKS